jgi:hypothetical protein
MQIMNLEEINSVAGGCDCHCKHPTYGDVACGDSDNSGACAYHCGVNGWSYIGCY